MQQWIRKQGIMGDDPPYLAVGTEVSAKYKGAFCEAKVRKVVRSVKCKVTFKQGLGTATVTDDQIKGPLRVGSVCEVKHPEKKEFVEATINKIQDCSQYTVVFDDGDITTLRRTALCLKSGRHFAESETLDQLPLTHPEHFGNPVIGGRKGRRSRQTHEESSDDEDHPKKGKKKEEKEADIGKVVCVELGDKKKQKDNWFPGLVVAPTAQDTVRIRVRDEYLVRSFKDGRYFTVPKKEATEFTREIGNKVDNNTLKTAVEKALQYLDRDDLPPHWDRDLLFGMNDTSGHSDSEGGLDSDSSDDEPREEKDHFVAQLYKFMDDRGTPINKGPTIGSRDVDLYKLFKVVHKLGGYNRVTNHNQWKTISHKMGFGQGSSGITNLVKQAYKKFLHSFEDFYRKLGCTMVNHPRGNRSRHRSGRSLIRDRDRATPVNTLKEKEKAAASTSEKSNENTEKNESQAEKKVEDEKKVEEKKEKEEVPKVKEQIRKEKGKVKEDKIETPSKEDRKSDKLKVKEEPEVSKSKEEKVKPNESARDDNDDKEERLRVRESKKDEKDKVKAKERDVKTKTVEEESEAGMVAEPKSKTKSKEVKVKKEERMKATVDRAKNDDKYKAKEDKVRDEKGGKEDPVKVPEEEKTEDPKKNEDSKKKVDKKIEEEEKVMLQQTRSKSKEDMRAKKEKEAIPRESRTPVRETERRLPPRPKKDDDMSCILKKRGRKRKDTDEKGRAEETMSQLASYIAVGVGDKLKVYYGPTHESKVTYEAKVLDIEEDSSERMYLVHYTGWNTRYDEWIKRGRIADNLSWTPSRAKRLRQQQAQLKMSKPMQSKRGRPSVSSRSQDAPSQQTPRSTTPSSVTSSSSRTKSPATRSGPTTRITRNTGEGILAGFEFRRRTRRMSGHTDISVASESESEEYDSDPEPEVEPTLTRSRSEKRVSTVEKESSIVEKEEPVSEESPKEEGKKNEKSLKKKCVKRKEQSETPTTPVSVIPSGEDEEEEKVIREEDSGDPPAEVPSTPPSVEKRRSKRTRKIAGSVLDKKEIEVKQELGKSEPGTESEEEQPKGRDFDLNQIRSELKGIEKAVKLPLDMPHHTAAEENLQEVEIVDDKMGILVIKSEVNEEIVQDKVIVDKTPEKVCDTSTEDIYEFKEPEPFEFEVRTKRESLLSEERTGKIPRRPIARLFEPVETKVEKSPRKKLVRTQTKPDPRDGVPFEGDVKKRFRRTPNKKTEEVTEPEKATVVQILPEVESQNSPPRVPEPVTPQKGRPLSACEEAFDKLCESPSFRLATKPTLSPSTPPILVLPDADPEPSKSPELEQLSLLHDDDGEDDNEDRLVISETDDMETEIEEPLFTYPQRDHEEIFPTLVSSEPSSSSVEPTSLPEQQQTVKIIEPPLLSQIGSDIFTSFSSGLDTKTVHKDESLSESVVQKQDIGVETACTTELTSSAQANEDVIKLLLKEGDDDEYEDDPINAAIQRVIAQTMMDEDTNDMDIFGGKQALCSGSNSSKQDIKSKSESPTLASSKKDIPIREFNKRKVGKKPVLSQEFVESDLSDFDSSDEDQRLVIDKIDDEESQTEEIESSSPLLDMKLPVSESSELEMKFTLVDPEENKTEEEEEEIEVTIEVPEQSNVIQVEEIVQDDGKGREEEEEEDEEEEEVVVVETAVPVEEEELDEKEDTIKRLRLDSESKPSVEDVPEEPPLVIPVIVKMDEDEDSKKAEPDPDPAPVIILETPITDVKDDITLLEEPITATIESECEEVKIEVKCEEEAESNLLGSLLCQETIPGSPAQVPEASADEAVEDKILLLEMPFASVPGSNCDPASTPTPAPVSPVPAEHLPPSQSPILPVPVSIAASASSPPPLLVQAPSPGVSKRNSNEAAPVMDNTPPTTPDSSLSTISGSPREEHGDLSPALDNESSKSHRDSFEIDLDSCAEGTKVDHYSEDDSLLNVEVSNSCDSRLQGLKLLPKKPCMDLDKEMDVSPKKRRRSRKRSECESNKRLRHSSGRSTRNMGGGGSDSDDTSENSTAGCTPLTSSDTLSSRSPRPSKYNFYVELAPELDGSQRIALLQQKLQELRKTYINVKAELACIDRRRKKLRRREREVEKATKQEVACS